MSVSGVLWRFLGAYVVLTICAVIALRMLGVSSSSGVNVAVLIGAVLWPCMAFGAKNKRFFTAAEKQKVVWGMIAINLLLQLVIGGGALAATGKLSAGALGMALAIVGVLHSIAIAIFVGLSRKMVEKQLEKLEGAAS